MSNTVEKMNKTVERLIAIRDNRCEDWKERDAVAYACNILQSLAEFLDNAGRL